MKKRKCEKCPLRNDLYKCCDIDSISIKITGVCKYRDDELIDKLREWKDKVKEGQDGLMEYQHELRCDKETLKNLKKVCVGLEGAEDE